MRALIQRCKSANVIIGNKKECIDFGMVVFVSFTKGDTIKEIDFIVNKIINLRIFDDKNGIMNLSILDVKGTILSISQFTLYADTVHGNRPSYKNALNGNDAIKLYDLFNQKLMEKVIVKTGEFGAEMLVNITNDGPVTILLESR